MKLSKTDRHIPIKVLNPLIKSQHWFRSIGIKHISRRGPRDYWNSRKPKQEPLLTDWMDDYEG